MQETLTLPPQTQNLIDQYLNLDFGKGRKVATPYFINRYGRRLSISAMVGKGTPEEIVEEAKVFAKTKRIDLSALNTTGLQEFMRKYGLGVDCSGFATNVLKTFVAEQYGKNLFSMIKVHGLVKWLLYSLHPIKNISVEVLADEHNSERLGSLNDIRPGDLIVTKSGKHVLIVGAIHSHVIPDLIGDPETKNKNKKVTKIIYYQSEEDKEVGEGEIEIVDVSSPLKAQRWSRPQDNVGDITVRRLRVA